MSNPKPTSPKGRRKKRRPLRSTAKRRPHARGLALTILTAVDRQARTLDTLLSAHQKELDTLSVSDRALCHALVFGVLRWRGRLDWAIAQFSQRKIHKIQPTVLNLLRLGLFQIQFMDRIPVSAAVNTAVELAKQQTGPWAGPFVNGVLRAAARKHGELDLPDVDADPKGALAVRHSMPPWLVARWLQRLGRDETTALCEAINHVPPITLRVNRLKTDRKGLIQRLKSEAAQVTSGDLSPDAVVLSGPRRPIHKLQAFQEGLFQVQDEAAQLVSRLVDPRPGHLVLDACAGLGGKTGHLAQLISASGKLWAVDNQAGRLEKLEAEMERLGVARVQTHCLDWQASVEPSRLPRFDCILVDAPCSGLGVLRRNPDAKWTAAKQNLARFHDRQVTILSSLASLVRPGGRMVYVVCSMEPEENQASINAFLKKHPGFAIVQKPKGLPPSAAHLVGPDGYFRTSPHRDHMDGFFAVVLKRIQR